MQPLVPRAAGERARRGPAAGGRHGAGFLRRAALEGKAGERGEGAGCRSFRIADRWGGAEGEADTGVDQGELGGRIAESFLLPSRERK